MGYSRLTDFQVEVAKVFFGLEASRGFVVAGGAALIASDLISRPTLDLDLFTHAPATSVIDARDQFLVAVERRGWSAMTIHEGESFCRLVIDGDDDSVLVDLAIDSPPVAEVAVTVLGPTLAPIELAGRKPLALFGRAEARDFGRDVLLAEASSSDPGFDPVVLAQMLRTLGRFADDEIPVADARVSELRTFFRDWARDLSRSD